MIALALSLLMAIQNPALTRGATVTGILRSALGEPATRVRVAATQAPGDPSETSAAPLVSLSETDEEGRYVLENIPPGRHYIVAGRVDRPTFYPGRLDSASGTILEIVSGQTISGINFVVDEASTRAPSPGPGTSLPRLPSITIPIRVIVEDGSPLPTTAAGRIPTIQLTETNGSTALEMSLSSTSLTLPSGSGEYSVRVANLPDGYVVTSMTFNLADLKGNTLKVPVTPPPRIVTLTGQGKLQEAIDQAAQRVAEASRTLSITLSRSGATRE